MKAFLGTIGLVLITVLGISQGFTVDGTINGLQNGAKISLLNANKPTEVIQSVTVKDNKFTFTGKVDEPSLYLISISDKDKALLFVENSNIKVNGSLTELNKLVVSGSGSHADFIDFQNIFNPLFNQYGALNKKAQAEGVSDQLRAEAMKLDEQTQKAIDAFIAQKKESVISALTLATTLQLMYDDAILKTRFEKISPLAQNSFYGKIISKKIEESSIGAVGTKAVEFTQNDANGKPISLSSFKGKYVLLDFWASWCGPCRKENPNVVAAFNKYKSKNFTILGISFDQEKAKWLKAVKDDNLNWAQVSDLKGWGNEVGRMYKISSIPQNLLINPEGIIVGKNLRGGELLEKLSILIK